MCLLSQLCVVCLWEKFLKAKCSFYVLSKLRYVASCPEWRVDKCAFSPTMPFPALQPTSVSLSPHPVCFQVLLLSLHLFASLTVCFFFSSTHSPGEWLISFSPEGPVPASGLCGQQQPPCQAELDPGEPDPVLLKSLEPWGAGVASSTGER